MAIAFSWADDIEEPVFTQTVLTYLTPNINPKQFHALKTGQFSWEAKLDVRGLTTEAAREALGYFISHSLEKKIHCLLIEHGLDSAHNAPPLLKNLMNRWLPQIHEVAAFHSAQAKDGGVGAVYVLLKKADLRALRRPPEGQGKDSYLVAETKAMERKRRLAEQQGERQLGPVKAREHSDQEPSPGPEGELQNTILQHPELDNQRFDGIDPNLNPEPPLNSEARREFDNERREQEMEKQLRLGNMPKFSTAPTPKGP